MEVSFVSSQFIATVNAYDTVPAAIRLTRFG